MSHSSIVRKIVSMPIPLAEAVDTYRFANRFATETEALRHLLSLGLEAATGKSSAPAALGAGTGGDGVA